MLVVKSTTTSGTDRSRSKTFHRNESLSGGPSETRPIKSIQNLVGLVSLGPPYNLLAITTALAHLRLAASGVEIQSARRYFSAHNLFPTRNSLVIRGERPLSPGCRGSTLYWSHEHKKELCQVRGGDPCRWFPEPF